MYAFTMPIAERLVFTVEAVDVINLSKASTPGVIICTRIIVRANLRNSPIQCHQLHLLENDLLDPSQERTRNNMGSEILQRAAATFILKIHETHQLPQSTMDTTLKELDSLYQVS